MLQKDEIITSNNKYFRHLSLSGCIHNVLESFPSLGCISFSFSLAHFLLYLNASKPIGIREMFPFSNEHAHHAKEYFRFSFRSFVRWLVFFFSFQLVDLIFLLSFSISHFVVSPLPHLDYFTMYKLNEADAICNIVA